MTRRKVAVFVAVYVAWTGLLFAVMSRPDADHCDWTTCGPTVHAGWVHELTVAALLAGLLTAVAAYLATAWNVVHVRRGDR